MTTSRSVTKTTEPTLSTAHRRIDFLFEWTWLLTILMVALAFNGQNFLFFFTQPKQYVIHLSGTILLGLWLFDLALRARYVEWSWKEATVSGAVRGFGSWLGKRPERWLILFVAVYSVGQIFSGIFSLSPETSFFGRDPNDPGYELYALLSYSLLFITIAVRLRTREQVLRLLRLTVFLGAGTAIYGIRQFLGYDPFGFGETLAISGTRVYSTYGNPIFFASVLIMTSGLTIGWAVIESNNFSKLKRRWVRYLPLVAGSAFVILQLGSIWLTSSRGPVFGIVAGMLALAIVAPILLSRRDAMKVFVVLLSPVLLAVILLIVVNSIEPGGSLGSLLSPLRGERIIGSVQGFLSTGNANTFTSGRLSIWQGAFELLGSRENWPREQGAGINIVRHVFGYGQDMYYRVFPLTATTQATLLPASHAHSFPLQVWLEGGYWGIISFVGLTLAIVALMVRMSVRLWRQRKAGMYDAFMGIFVVSLWGVLVGRVVEQVPGVSRAADLVFFWTIIGLVVVFDRMINTGKSTTEPAFSPAQRKDKHPQLKRITDQVIRQRLGIAALALVIMSVIGLILGAVFTVLAIGNGETSLPIGWARTADLVVFFSLGGLVLIAYLLGEKTVRLAFKGLTISKSNKGTISGRGQRRENRRARKPRANARPTYNWYSGFLVLALVLTIVGATLYITWDVRAIAGSVSAIKFYNKNRCPDSRDVGDSFDYLRRAMELDPRAEEYPTRYGRRLWRTAIATVENWSNAQGSEREQLRRRVEAVFDGSGVSGDFLGVKIALFNYLEHTPYGINALLVLEQYTRLELSWVRQLSISPVESERSEGTARFLDVRKEYAAVLTDMEEYLARFGNIRAVVTTGYHTLYNITPAGEERDGYKDKWVENVDYLRNNPVNKNDRVRQMINLAADYQQSDRTDEAVLVLTEAAEYGGNLQGEVYLNLAAYYQRLGNLTETIRSLELALQVSSTAVSAGENLARLRAGEASRTLSTFLRLVIQPGTDVIAPTTPDETAAASALVQLQSFISPPEGAALVSTATQAVRLEQAVEHLVSLQTIADDSSYRTLAVETLIDARAAQQAWLQAYPLLEPPPTQAVEPAPVVTEPAPLQPSPPQPEPAFTDCLYLP